MAAAGIFLELLFIFTHLTKVTLRKKCHSIPSVTGMNVRYNWKPFCAAWRYVFTYSISYCKDKYIILNVIVRQMPLNIH